MAVFAIKNQLMTRNKHKKIISTNKVSKLVCILYGYTLFDQISRLGGRDKIMRAMNILFKKNTVFITLGNFFFSI